MTATVRYEPYPRGWSFGGERRSHNGADSIVIKSKDLTVGTATDLARALRKAREREEEPDSILIDLAPDDEYSPKEAVVDTISFSLLDSGRLAVEVVLSGDRYFDEDSDLVSILMPLVEPLLRRSKAEIVAVRSDGYRSTAPYWHNLTVVVPTRSRTLRQLYDVAKSIELLFDAAMDGIVTRETVVDLVTGGRVDLLVGLREGPWLDVKSRHYDLSANHGQISLAQAVSRFCNAEDGGVVIVGMETKRIPGGETIKSVKPVPVDTSTVRRYRQAIESRIYPFPFGLKIEVVESRSSHGLVVVSVPPQDEEMKPFLVHGAIVGDRIEGAYISIVRRSGEDSIPITAHQIHSTLAAGRALLRRGELPREKGMRNT